MGSLSRPRGTRRSPINTGVGGRSGEPLALAEIVANPRASRAKHLLYFGAGAGSGAALIVNGALYRGAHGLAGAIGHVAVPEAGMVVCRCGKVGCLEAVSGGWAIARDGLLLAESGRSEASRAFSPRAARFVLTTSRSRRKPGTWRPSSSLTRTSALLGKSLASLVSLFAPEMLVVGGGIARAGEIALRPCARFLLAQLPEVAAQDFIVELSVWTEQVGGVLGATQLARRGAVCEGTATAADRANDNATLARPVDRLTLPIQYRPALTPLFPPPGCPRAPFRPSSGHLGNRRGIFFLTFSGSRNIFR